MSKARKSKIVNPKLSRRVRTLKAMAGIIQSQCGIPCDRMKLKNWQVRRDPPFPMADENNCFDVAECLAWVREHIREAKLARARQVNAKFKIQNSKGEAKPAEVIDAERLIELSRKAEIAKYQNTITDDEEAKFDLELKKGLHIERTLAEFTVKTALRGYHGMVKTELETSGPAKRRIKLGELARQAGLDVAAAEKLAGEFFAWDTAEHQAVIDRIENRCEAQSKDEDGG